MNGWVFLLGCLMVCITIIYVGTQLSRMILQASQQFFDFMRIYAKANDVPINMVGAGEEETKFLVENKKKEGITELPSGLQYEILKKGEGQQPFQNDTVKVHYHGTLLDGTVFDSSVDRGEPATFKVDGVIAGWTQALQLMAVGSKWKLYIPSKLAYGKQGAGNIIKPFSALIFEVELIEIIKK